MADATTIKPLNRDEEAFLRALGRVITYLPRVVDADMLEEQPISATEYMVLVLRSHPTTGGPGWPFSPAPGGRS
ncbi:hypothetical protein [Streptomyces flaveus]|uniref:hypothetical protein n=1 Tax=Streptomyces flaveus TaxID=66370 RepID=UPI001AE009B6|nr:hypothetical protein [Streptomyces flaveus]